MEGCSSLRVNESLMKSLHEMVDEVVASTHQGKEFVVLGAALNINAVWSEHKQKLAKLGELASFSDAIDLTILESLYIRVFAHAIRHLSKFLINKTNLNGFELAVKMMVKIEGLSDEEVRSGALEKMLASEELRCADGSNLAINYVVKEILTKIQSKNDVRVTRAAYSAQKEALC